MEVTSFQPDYVQFPAKLRLTDLVSNDAVKLQLFLRVGGSPWGPVWVRCLALGHLPCYGGLGA